MRKPLLVLTAFAAVAITASAVDRTEASPLVNPSALSGVVDDLGIFDNVHCRPGRRHHDPTRWRRADGCARNTGAVVVVPGRTRYIYRDGVRVRVGGTGARTTVRSTERTTVRTRTNTNVRGGGAATQRDGGSAGAGAGTQGGGGVQKGGGSQKGGSQN